MRSLLPPQWWCESRCSVGGEGRRAPNSIRRRLLNIRLIDIITLFVKSTGAYCYCYYLGLSCMILPWATPDKLAGPARNAQVRNIYGG